ncbi:MAG TPA: choice-of-anchor tandem repeat GloVer-containing protein [Candidatus Cybelea sp.]|nr:choice-of-anchor tandem repeat GloVer-containing protein [Candidatus Cybelea sp.]
MRPAYGVIYSFHGPRSDGETPYSSLAVVNGLLYGTTEVGGKKNTGTTFAISPGSTKESHLYSFGGASSDGAYPKAGVSYVSGMLYGTTTEGGTSSYGTVFAIMSNQPKTLHSFEGKSSGDGANPAADLSYVKSNDTFYGTTQTGGKHGLGAVFEITSSGVEKVIYSFKGKPDGYTPISGLFNSGGTLYGTTELGGKHNEGTVYAISLSGQESVIYSFGEFKGDGEYPRAGVRTPPGKVALYGTTYNGGTSGKGTVFEISTNGTGYQVLYNFGLYPDAENPLGEITAINGTLYGTTAHGGMHRKGSVFKLTSSNVETRLHDFPSDPGDGTGPARRLTVLNGMLYGTTRYGGKGKCPGYGGCGTIFWVAP